MWKLKSKNTSAENIKAYLTKSFEKLLSREDLGFKDTKTFEETRRQCESLHSFYKDKKRLVIVGIGGSALGAKALCAALYPQTWSDKIEFLDNVDSFTSICFCKRWKSLKNTVGFLFQKVVEPLRY